MVEGIIKMTAKHSYFRRENKTKQHNTKKNEAKPKTTTLSKDTGNLLKSKVYFFSKYSKMDWQMTATKLCFPGVRCDPIKWCELQVQMERQFIPQLREHRTRWGFEEKHLRDMTVNLTYFQCSVLNKTISNVN